MSSMLLMLLLSSSSRIFALRSFSSGLRFLLVICFPSCLMPLFYTLLWRFTQNLERSLQVRTFQGTNIPTKGLSNCLLETFERKYLVFVEKSVLLAWQPRFLALPLGKS